jgi:DNA-directed RNA polymerase subunit RPC12/RpoP
VTIAVCIRCGEMKFGAWLACPNCGFQPESGVEKAKSILASDHYFTPEYLEGAAEQIKKGTPPVFSDEQVTSLARDIEKQDYFLINFDPDSGTIKCMKCGRPFLADSEMEAVLCLTCSRDA